MTASAFTDFGGSGNQELPVVAASRGDPQQMGQLEGTPHGFVHLWTTDHAPDMGALASLSGALHNGALDDDAGSYVFPQRHQQLVSRPEELHPWPLAERSVRLSPHFAPIRRTCRSCRSASEQRGAG